MPVKNGYTSFQKQTPPRGGILLAQVEAVLRGAYQRDFKLDLDPNGSWRDAETAIPILQKLAAHPNVAMFETPIPQSDVDGNKQIRPNRLGVRSPCTSDHPPIPPASVRTYALDLSLVAVNRR